MPYSFIKFLKPAFSIIFALSASGKRLKSPASTISFFIPLIKVPRCKHAGYCADLATLAQFRSKLRGIEPVVSAPPRRSGVPRQSCLGKRSEDEAAPEARKLLLGFFLKKVSSKGYNFPTNKPKPQTLSLRFWFVCSP